MKVQVQTITPAVAEKLLAKQAPNRTLSRRRVTVLAEALSSGTWLDDGSTVRISTEGLLLDGQHRLSAIVESSVTVDLLVASEIDPAAQLTIDTNRPRRFADYLDIRDVPASRSLAASTRFLWNYQHGIFAWKGDLTKRPTASNIDLWELFQANEKDLRDGDDLSYPVHRFVRASRAMLGGMWVVLSEIDAGDADEFYLYLAQKFDGPANDAAAAFTRNMNNASRGNFGGRKSQREQTALFIKTWNAYRTGETPGLLMWRGGGKNPEVWPIPV